MCGSTKPARTAEQIKALQDELTVRVKADIEALPPLLHFAVQFQFQAIADAQGRDYAAIRSAYRPDVESVEAMRNLLDPAQRERVLEELRDFAEYEAFPAEAQRGSKDDVTDVLDTIVQRYDTQPYSLSKIIDAFEWDKTPEGSDYWYKVWGKIADYEDTKKFAGG